MRRVASLLTAASLLPALLGGCATGDARVEGATAERVTSTRPPSTTPPPSTPSTTIEVQLLPPVTAVRPEGPVDERDWEGQRYDFGAVTEARRVGGEQVIDFDRYQLRDPDGGFRSGRTLTEEPVLFGNSDTPFKNVNPRLRTFTVADDATVIVLDPEWSCDDRSPGDLPEWVPLSFDQLMAFGGGAGRQDALTFDAEGRVSQIRLSRGC